MSPLLSYAAILFLAAIAGSALPLLVKRADRPLHLLLALAAGVFLGVVFLHLLPEVAEMAHAAGADAEAAHVAAADRAEHDGHDHAGHDHADEPAGTGGATHRHGGTHLWLCVLLGVAGLFVLQNLIFKGEGHVHHDHAHGVEHHAHDHADRRRHVAVGYAALLGLGVHEFTAGVGLAAAVQADAGLGDSLFLSILGHKVPESFSLATLFLLTGMPLVRIGFLVVVFALTTPAGILLGSWFAGAAGVEVLTAVATGTFLYVAVAHLLPEVFHNRVDVLLRLLLVAAGVGLSVWVPELSG